MADRGRDLRRFYRDCWRESNSRAWVAVNGLFGGLAAVVMAVLMPLKIFADHPNWDAIATFIIYAVVAYGAFLVAMLFFVSPFLIWRKAEAKAVILEARLAPKFTAVFDSNKDPCKSVSEFRDGRGNSKNGMVFRIEVENTSAEIIHACEGYLTEIFFEGEVARLGAFNLFWSGAYPLELKVDLKPHVKRQLDLFVIYEGESADVSIISPSWPPNNQERFFSRLGYYLFTVVVSANDSTLPPYKLRLNFMGDWRTSSLEVMAT